MLVIIFLKIWNWNLKTLHRLTSNLNNFVTEIQLYSKFWIIYFWFWKNEVEKKWKNDPVSHLQKWKYGLRFASNKCARRKKRQKITINYFCNWVANHFFTASTLVKCTVKLIFLYMFAEKKYNLPKMLVKTFNEHVSTF